MSGMELGKKETMNFLQVTYDDGTKGLVRLEYILRFRSMHPSLGAGTVIILRDGASTNVRESLDDIEAVMRNIVQEG